MSRKTASKLLVHTTLAKLGGSPPRRPRSARRPLAAEDGIIRILCSFALASGNPGLAQIPPNLNAFRLGSFVPESTAAQNISQRVL
jgi:hypothetical protein